MQERAEEVSEGEEDNEEHMDVDIGVDTEELDREVQRAEEEEI
eukprot:CAMPEP_0201282988 /NCGR_PEP_ID=MMETSP1317-20130820/7222_1 /ASSEMBLY_ACC=CAM_ASM_000770 /TAXON_ID=187299 /ORGANISM="Undescribed Undescribed, Strain Undescribed" /LENGTH=42 /DNA_ID= /DNA_START= /DNA_END= /DNA_ORIENTATION=